MHSFRIRISRNAVEVDVTRHVFPGSGPSGVCVTALGMPAELDAFLARHQHQAHQVLTHGAAATVYEEIRVQARATPLDVGLPISMATIPASGITWQCDVF